MEIIKFNDLSFKYDNSAENVLQNIDFSIKKGEFITICGMSGSGKSTLVKLLKNFNSIGGEISGDIEFDNEKISTVCDRVLAQKIAFVTQNPDEQIVTDKVWHELAFGMENIGLSQGEMSARIAEIANYFGINSWFDKNTFELSGGQKQILNLASAMCLQPEVIVLDEPMSQLDPIACDKFCESIKKINTEFGTTIIIVEHNLERIFEFSDKILILEDGKVGFYDKPACVVDEVYEKNDKNQIIMPLIAKISKEIIKHNKCTFVENSIRKDLKDLNICDKNSELMQNIEFKSKNNLLTVKNLFFRYFKDEKDVVKDLNLDIFNNEILSIVGANGSGKSTFLKLLCGVKKPNQGKIVKNNPDLKISYLPQNSQNLFVNNNVYDEISEYKTHDFTNKIDNIIEICNLQHLLEKHPYDVSGGEQQRVALAKILISEPDVLVLDEPTNGIDLIFKRDLIEILRKLKQNGLTIVIVTHDLDFSADISDRCAMFFDGKIVSCEETEKFYCKNKYYTTSVRKLTHGIFDNIVTLEKLRKLMGIEHSCDLTSEIYTQKNILHSDENVLKPVKTKPINIYLLTSLLVFMPLTIWLGIEYFGDRKYYFISYMLIFETFIPFIIDFEKSKPKAKEIVFLASFCAMIVASRAIFFMLPQFKPVLALIVISGVVFGPNVGFLIGSLSMFLSNFMFGHGPWTPWQIFAMGIVGAISGILFVNKPVKRLKISIFGAILTILVYGVIMNASSVFISQLDPSFAMMKSAIIIGFPMDFVHAIATFVFLYFGSELIIEKILRIKTKYNIFD